MTVSDIAAFSALAVAIWSAVQTGRFNRRQNAFAETAERLNRLLIDKESAESQAQREADVGANFVKIAKNDYRLKVFNRGPVAARNVRLEFLAGGEVMMASELKQKLPVPALERHQTVELMAASICSHHGAPICASTGMTMPEQTIIRKSGQTSFKRSHAKEINSDEG
ncbi:hypothetical protein ACFSLT_28840 [Novosphingobium resinovorum]